MTTPFWIRSIPEPVALRKTPDLPVLAMVQEAKLSNEDSKILLRVPTQLLDRIKTTCIGPYSPCMIGLISYALERLEAEQQTLVISSDPKF